MGPSAKICASGILVVFLLECSLFRKGKKIQCWIYIIHQYSPLGNLLQYCRLQCLFYMIDDLESENVIWFDRRKVCICDCNGGFFVPRNVVSVHHAIEIKLSLNLVTISNDLRNSLPRPHFLLGSCVGGVKGS